MNEHHPDKRVQSGGKPGEGAIAAETITHAYQTLRDPHARACHWLELHGCPLGEERESGSPTDLVGTDFLLGVMERREAIEDHEGDAEALGALAGEVEGLRASCEAALEDLMDEGEGRGSESVLERARRLTAQLQYWNRLEEALEEAAEP